MLIDQKRPSTPEHRGKLDPREILRGLFPPGRTRWHLDPVVRIEKYKLRVDQFVLNFKEILGSCSAIVRNNVFDEN